MPALDDICREKMDEMRRKSRLRVLDMPAHPMVSFSSNDYLGLAQHDEVVKAAAKAARECGAGAGASRLVAGNYPLLGELELALAEWKDTEAALVFGSGYLANTGVIPALVGKGDLILADKLAHACMLDGAKLSGAKLLRFAHNDAADALRLLEAERGKYRHCLLMTESVFSMDGDQAPLAVLEAICRQHDAWLLVDDAHTLGDALPITPDVLVGTLSKALGSYGGFVAGTHTLVQYLASSARPFIFSTAPAPAAIGAALKALEIVRAEPERGRTAHALARHFALELGLTAPEAAIVPLVIGKDKAALEASEHLGKAGFYVKAIRPPTVPEGTARLRFSFSASHTADQVDRLIAAIRRQQEAAA